MKWMILVRRIGATALFMLGVVGLILPVLPGIFFIAIGLYVLSIDSPGLESRINVLRGKYHHVHKTMNHVEARFGKRNDVILKDMPLERTEV